MIVNRMVLRLAAVNALTNFGQAPFPTLVENMVFDSRIEPVEDFKEEEILPVVVIYTDYDKDHWPHRSAMNKDRVLTVTFELLLAQVTEAPPNAGQPGSFVVRYPNTDSAIETALDMLEVEIADALAADNPAANCWKHLITRHVAVVSRRGATVEGGTKLAARQVTVEAVMPRGPVPGLMPPEIGAFLDKLEQHEDYRSRVPLLRNAYLKPDNLTPSEMKLRLLGLSNEAGAALSYLRGVQPVSAPPVVWLNGNS